MFASISGTKIKCKIQTDIFRPYENIQVIGSYNKIHKETGWEPKITLEKTLSDLLEYWEKAN